MLGKWSRQRIVRERLPAMRTRLLRLALAWCRSRDVAEDLTHEAMAKALERAAQLRDPQALDTWLFSILANCHRDWLRRSARYGHTDEELAGAEPGPEAAAETLELAERVRTAVAALSCGQRQVVTLVDLEGLSYADAARVLEVPVGTVMSRLCRGREALRARLIPAQRGALQPPRLERIK